VKQPKWLSVAMVMAIHDEVLSYFGGSAGVRDAALLQSAIDRPGNRLAYESTSNIFELAAGLCVGIAKNRAFIDGNKRTALLATRAFLFLNGQIMEPSELEEVTTMVALATGELSEAKLALWLRANCRSARRRRRSPSRS
jgi:death-on-curing protein